MAAAQFDRGSPEDFDSCGSHPLDVDCSILEAGDVQARKLRGPLRFRVVDITLRAETCDSPVADVRRAVVVVHLERSFWRAYGATFLIAGQPDRLRVQHREAVAASWWRPGRAGERGRYVDDSIKVAAFEYKWHQASGPGVADENAGKVSCGGEHRVDVVVPCRGGVIGGEVHGDRVVTGGFKAFDQWFPAPWSMEGTMEKDECCHRTASRSTLSVVAGSVR